MLCLKHEQGWLISIYEFDVQPSVLDIDKVRTASVSNDL